MTTGCGGWGSVANVGRFWCIMLSQLVLDNCRFIVKLLGGVGDRLVPFIITDMSLKNVNVRNWSSMVSDRYCVFSVFSQLMNRNVKSMPVPVRFCGVFICFVLG